MILAICFKPQRGKFTLLFLLLYNSFIGSFKPQRGKFTRATDGDTTALIGFQTPTG